jgi:hypothetical protein
MRLKVLFLVLVSVLIAFPSLSQEKSKKEIKEEKKLAAQKQIEELMNSKEFKFVGTMAYPTGMKSMNLTTNTNFMKFEPEMIESAMPFFGQAYSGVGYTNDTGIKFKAKPDKFEITKAKKNYEIQAEVKGEKDFFRISGTVGFEGGASFTIISNNRSSIMFRGDISPLE